MLRPGIEEMVGRIVSWRFRCMALSDAYKPLANTIGLDSPLVSAAFHIVDRYTELLSETLGDDFEWLSWYANECDYGRTPRKAKGSKSKLVEIKTEADLARLIEESWVDDD